MNWFLQISISAQVWEGVSYLKWPLILWVTYKAAQRYKRDKKISTQQGYIIYAFAGVLAYVLYSLALLGLWGIGQKVHHYFTLPRYQAEVIDHQDYERKERRNTGTHRTTFYTPVVRFQDEQGHTHQALLDVSSSEPLPIGQIITIGYESGMELAQEYSHKSAALLLGFALMGCVLMYAVVWSIYYAHGWDASGLLLVGIRAVQWLLVPLGMLGLLVGMGYFLYSYLLGKQPNAPLWAVLMVSFFELMLLLSLWGYIKHIFSPEEQAQSEDWEEE